MNEQESGQNNQNQQPRMRLKDVKQTWIKQRKKPEIISTPSFSSDTHIEQFYYNLLVLFSPFRNEDDLIRDEESAQMAFVRWKSQLDLSRIPAQCRPEIEAAYVRATLFTVNPQNPDPNQNLISAIQDRVNNSQDENYQAMLNNLLEEDSDSEEFEECLQTQAGVHLPRRDEHEKAVFQLNGEQTVVYKTVKSRVQAQTENRTAPQTLVFITGAGGTGKSYLLRLVKELLMLGLDYKVNLVA